MSQIILLEDNENLKDLLTINLTTYVGAEVIPRTSSKEAIELLNLLPTIDLVIARDQIGKENTAEEMLNYFRINDLETILIVVGEAPTYGKGELVNIKDPNKWENIIRATAKLLGVTNEELEKKLTPDYVAVELNYFFSIRMSPCDVFMRVHKAPTEFNYVKKISKQEKFSHSEIQNFKDQGLKYFYVAKENLEYFTTFVSNSLVKKLENPRMELNERIDVIGDSFEVATNEIVRLGFNTATVQLTESIVDNMVDSFEKSPELSGFIHKLINSKTNYLYQQGYITSVVATDIVGALKVNDYTVKEKISFASFFQNISLVDNEELARIDSYEELEEKEFPDDLWELAFNHAADSAKIASEFPNINDDVFEMIIHHHGTTNGKGYSNKNIEEMLLYPRVFLIASEFANIFLKFKEKNIKKPVIEALYERYPLPKAVHVLDVLDGILKSKQNAKF